MPEGGDIGEEEEEHLMKTFEEIQYLIEDLDNANSKTWNMWYSETTLIRTSLGLIESVLNNEVSSFNGYLSKQMWHLGEMKVSCLIG